MGRPSIPHLPPGVTYGFGIVASAYGHDGAAAREPPALVAMRIIAHPAMISIAANDPQGGGSRTAAPHGAPWPETIRHTLFPLTDRTWIANDR
jgi:hypothetical protein